MFVSPIPSPSPEVGEGDSERCFVFSCWFVFGWLSSFTLYGGRLGWGAFGF